MSLRRRVLLGLDLYNKVLLELSAVVEKGSVRGLGLLSFGVSGFKLQGF